MRWAGVRYTAKGQSVVLYSRFNHPVMILQIP